MTDTKEQLAFGSYHLKYDPDKHLAAWGARLLWDEIMAGGKGLVHDRQDAIGDPEKVRQIWPVVDRLVEEARLQGMSFHWSSGSNEKIERREGFIAAVISPQGSYGYLYVTGVVDK